MAGYELRRLDDVFVIRWIGTPTRASVAALGDELGTALRAAKSPPALWIVIDTERSDLPPPDARTALQDGARSLFGLTRSVDLVILGTGLRASLMRTLLRTMAIVARIRDRMHVHEGVEEAARGRTLDPKLVAALRGSA